jgi:mevalonate kinase
MSRKARLTKNMGFIKQLIQETELVGMSEKEALEYIEVKLGKSISSQSYYRLKKQVRSDPIRHAWLTYYAKTGFVDHYRDRLSEMQMIQKDLLKMWVTEISKADNEQDKYLMLQIARSIRENNVVLSQLGVSLPIISSMKNIMDKSTQMRAVG